MQNYYNTNNEAGIVLASSKGKARKQQDIILDFFKRNPNQSYTPHEILTFCFPKKPHHNSFEVPITSVRRAITNLTENGDLEKTGLMKQCVYGKMVHTWKFRDKTPDECAQLLFEIEENLDRAIYSGKSFAERMSEARIMNNDPYKD